MKIARYFAGEILKCIFWFNFVFWFHLSEVCYWGSSEQYANGLAQDCSNSIANALELLQSSTKPLMWWLVCVAYQDIVCISDDPLLNEKFCILIRISQKFVPRGPVDNKWALVQVMAWRWTGDKPLPEPMLMQFTDAYMQH